MNHLDELREALRAARFTTRTSTADLVQLGTALVILDESERAHPGLADWTEHCPMCGQPQMVKVLCPDCAKEAE